MTTLSSDSPRSAPGRKPALGFIFVTLVLMMLGVGIIIPVLPDLVTSFTHGSIEQGSGWYGWLGGIFAAAQFLASPILGSLSDRFGRRKVILIALAGSAIDYVIMGFAPTIWWLFVARTISGITAGTLATCNAYVADVTTPKNRAQGFGMVGGALGIGFIVGPVVGGLLGSINLHLPFFVAAGCVAANWLYGAFLLPESLPPEKRRPFSWKRANPVGSLTTLRSYRGLMNTALMFFMVTFAQAMLQSIWVLSMKFRFGWTTRQQGFSLMLAGLVTAIVQGGLVKKILSITGERRGLITGLFIITMALIGYGTATRGWMIYIIIFLGGLGGIAAPAAQAIITKNVPGDAQGAVQGALSGLNSISYIFAPLLSTWSFAHAIDPTARWQIPGIAFYEAALLEMGALFLAFRAFREADRHPPISGAGAGLTE